MDKQNLAVTSIISAYHVYDREFWLDYKTLEKLMSKEEFNEIKLSLLKSKIIDQEYIESIGIEKFKTERDVLDAEWKKKSEDAKKAGTEVHERINSLLTSRSAELNAFEINVDSVRVADEFMNSTDGIFTELRLEWDLDEEFKLVGVPDCIIIKDSQVTIIDWKTSEDGIKFKGYYEVSKKKTKRMKYPLSKLDDANGIHYTLQLGLYAWMIEKIRPDLKIEKLKIAQIKNFKVYKTFEIPYLKEDVDRLLEYHVQSIKIDREMQKCNLIEY